MINEIIRKIKDKEPLDRLDDNFVIYFLEDFFKKNPKMKIKLQNETLKKTEIKVIVKNVRNELNKIYGQFWKNKNSNLSLEMHQSSKERMEFYEALYKRILDITGRPSTILDLGAGLNPLSYNLIGKDVYFIVNELTGEDCDKLRWYLDKNNFKFEVLQGDITKIKELPKVDVCFMFKILDSLDFKGHKISEEIIEKVKAKYIIASFSNVTTRNREMNYPRRGWFEMMLNRLDYKFNKLEFLNEVFYVIRKS